LGFSASAPVARLGWTYFFVIWVSDAVLDNVYVFSFPITLVKLIRDSDIVKADGKGFLRGLPFQAP